MSLEEIFAKLKAQRAPQPQGQVEWLIAGLGNPGKEYAATRHNIGFITVDRLAEQEKFEIKKIKFKSLIADTMLAGKRCIVMKPSTFMNNSGEAVGECARFYHIEPQKILVIYDDINFEPGVMRIRKQGSDGGHNGMKSIIYHLNSNAFARIRMGVGAKPHPDYDLADWVLSKFSEKEVKAIEPAIDDACEAVRLIVGGNIDEAMNKYN
ncbi:MAG: aminoacyl-tRNA hydrolase [Clostridia bacterium]|nr:aminoacyl-tRNA hydrolase [Clostridia bacterium]